MSIHRPVVVAEAERLEVLPNRGSLIIAELGELLGLDIDRDAHRDASSDEVRHDLLVDLPG